ncbi:MAG: tRNA (cytidine(56)-2'-O)-methyltransferase [Thermoplasmatota archaeon]
MASVTVLRLGHRPQRDARMTTHVCLTARAFGADRVIVAEKDDDLERGIRSVVKRFGGPFDIETGAGYRKPLKDSTAEKVHLTMYGLPFEEVVPKLAWPKRDVLVVVGAEKVPRDVYDLVDWNVSVGNEPHSEVAALAVFLHALLGEKGLHRSREGGTMRVRGSARGKDVEST